MVKITKTTIHCDYCGEKIEDPVIRIIKTPWQIITYWARYGILSSKIVGGHGCRKCYKSYRKWANSRKRRGEKQ